MRSHSSPSSASPSMFSSSSNFQINGGNFCAGDMNVYRAVQPPGHDESVLGVQDNAHGRRPVGLERTHGHLGGGMRMLPYDVSHRPHILSNLNSSSFTDTRNSLALDHPRLQAPGNIQLPPIDPLRAHKAGDALSRLDDMHHGMNNRRIIEYYPEAEPRSSGSEFNDPSLSPVEPSLPNPRPPFPLQPNWSEDALSTNVHPDSSTNSGQGLSTFGQPPRLSAGPVSGSLAKLDSSFPWDRPPHEPKTSINGGIFISGNVNNYGENGLHILHRNMAVNALHDSAERYPQPKCHPDTRTEILDVLHQWACGTVPPRNWVSTDYGDSGESRTRILWLYGPAGSGKSAIAQSFCEQLQGEGRLGGSFFFKRGSGSRGNARKLFATIAYQFALVHTKLNHAISRTVQNDPAIVNRSLSNQLQNLVIESCRRTPLTHPVCVVIDGLDECKGQHIQQEILRAIATAMRGQPLPVLFFIASRPEAHISEVFKEPLLDGFHRALNIRQSFEDVRKYLLKEFSRIQREHHTMAAVSRPWPPSEVIEDLVDKSSGYFIYASTIIKYIDDKNFRPTDRLEIILGIKKHGLASPFYMLDQVYIRVLCDVPLESRPRLLQILTISVLNPLFIDLRQIEQILELHPGDVHLVLRNLHSVIKVPDKDARITAHHTSFLDFLEDPERSGPFYIGGSQHCVDLLRCILKALAYKGNDGSLTKLGHSCWALAPRCFERFPSIQTSLPDFVPLLLNINPDFLFFATHSRSPGSFDWWNLGADLPLWNDYQFMLQCEEVWWVCSKELTTEWDSRNHHEVWLQVSPQLIRILRAFMVFPKNTNHILFQLHLFLDLSWDEMRGIICPLRALVGEDKQRLQELFAFASDPTLIAEPKFHSIIRELALGGLHVMTGLISNKIYMCWRPPSYPCGFFLRLCGPAADFLSALEAFKIAWASREPETSAWVLQIRGINHIHNLLQWFKTFPQLGPPLEVLTRLEQRLKPLGRTRTDYSLYPDPEVEWIQWLEKHSKYLVCFTETSPT